MPMILAFWIPERIVRTDPQGYTAYSLTTVGINHNAEYFATIGKSKQKGASNLERFLDFDSKYVLEFCSRSPVQSDMVDSPVLLL